MLKVDFYELGKITEEKLKYVVIQSQYQNQWVLVRHKQRDTWEIPGGHIEEGESASQAASRELFEETGAKAFELIPVCTYSVTRGEEQSYGQLFYSKITTLVELPDSEIAEIKFFKKLPPNLTYSQIQPHLHHQVIDFIKDRSN
ncbi:NUDIX hydrolase [Vallitalea okinawensis]|uniref:NUDIX hydrolase n=1 Tax=Vallitalea okinawensis TaxID=2078660 RepID=UPI000CFDF27D|nr:NUDIX domain-containing protein [Vallitalea okinawensis]